MVVVRRRALALLPIVLACAACGPPQRTPTQTVELYFAARGHDPIRTLALLTPEFHARHGLRFEDVRGVPPWRTPAGGRPEAEGRLEPAPPTDDRELELERARHGWLSVQMEPFMRRLVPRLGARVLSEAIEGDAAVVKVIVAAGRAARVEVGFRLGRDAPGGPWRIHDIDVPEATAPLVALVVAPSAARWEQADPLRSSGRMP
jgi:hypothetical protein